MTRALIIAMAAALMAASLGSCGKQGGLERPGPLWGAKAKAEYEAQKRRQADVKTNEAQSNQAVPDEGPGSDPNVNPSPSRTQPIEGQRPNPFGVQQPGALPDPYARPQ